jgi:hypothetical protein
VAFGGQVGVATAVRDGEEGQGDEQEDGHGGFLPVGKPWSR